MTRPLTAEEVEADYEGNTGRHHRTFCGHEAAECRPCWWRHGPFTWGRTRDSVKNAMALEAVAEMASAHGANPQAP